MLLISYPGLAVIVTIVGAWSLYSFWFRQNSKLLPPGPPRLPIIGNLHQAPKLNPWRTYQEWTKKYGPIFSLQYGKDTVIILGTSEAARDLLDKRSNIYSSRPHSVMGGDCVSKGYRTLLMPYSDRWRKHQRLQASYLNIRISQTYRPLQDLESKQLIYEMLSTDDFSDRFHRYSSSLIFALAYGKRLLRGDEREAQEIEEIMENFLYAARIGTWIVDAIPALNYLPAFLAPWKRIGDKFHNIEARLYTTNMSNARKTESWNWSKQVSPMKEAQEMSNLELAYDIGITYEAGSDTTTMALEVFTMAAVLNPSFVQRAQEELDNVVGVNRLPNFDDRGRLPFIEAVVKEVLRWRPVSAGGIPHAVVQDDEYMGFRIPKDAIVIGNHWSIHLDQDVYQDAYEFKPERWIDNPELPLRAFGFGRRVCTGQHIAGNSLFINIARLLWAFDIGYAYENGQRQEIDSLAMTQGFNSRPMPFKASFKVRDLGRKLIVEREWANAEKGVDIVLEGIHSSM